MVKIMMNPMHTRHERGFMEVVKSIYIDLYASFTLGKKYYVN